ncbi:hypothetical protein CVT26_008622 [Gymnopilus dilepis]|uniref:Uncharacterized protein n=1 Tax=Gymnopilus dilepis TaxID=231916 RepID=A0A409XXV1_9AGAR|nr:hypothetical protein CVT26_008622 [Gymnopilus dilepis]
MSALPSTKLFAFLFFALALLHSAAQNDTEAYPPPTPHQVQEFNTICANRAQENGEDVPSDWVWSVTDEDCVKAGGFSSTATTSGTASNDNTSSFGSDDTTNTSDDNSLAGDVDTAAGDEENTVAAASDTVGDALSPLLRRDKCQEGSLQRCLQDCNDMFNPTKYKSGESGAWVGCRASCNFRCSTNVGGCYNGWCWASCVTGVPLVEGHEWCYTTRGYSQDYNYIRCSHNEDCDVNWKCAGPCAAF